MLLLAALAARCRARALRVLLRPPADVRACRNCAPPDGKVQPAAPAAAAAPPVPPPKPAAFAQPSAAAFKAPTAVPPSFDLLGGVDAPAPAATWNAFAEPPKDDWMADFVAPAPAAVAPSSTAVEWDAFASAPVVPAPTQHNNAAILDLFGPPAPDLAGQLAGMQVCGGPAAAPPALPAKPAKPSSAETFGFSL